MSEGSQLSRESTQSLNTNRTPFERQVRDWLSDAIARTLEVAVSEIDTGASIDSFALESVVVFQITGELAEWLGVELEASLLWDYPTIDALASFLAGRAAGETHLPRRVVPLREGANRLPLFCLGGIHGHPFLFNRMVAHLSPEQPTYGLTVPGFDGLTGPLTRIEGIAETLLGDLFVVQPHGPYQLVGYSFGGIVAYEMAQQLRARGQDVALLGMYDTLAPGGMVERPVYQRLAGHLARLVAGPGRGAYIKERAAAVRQRLGRCEDGESVNETLDHRSLLRLSSERAARDYEPRRYAGDLVLFRASMQDPAYRSFVRIEATNGWSRFVDGQIHVVHLPGAHLTLFAQPNARTIAETLTPWLQG